MNLIRKVRFARNKILKFDPKSPPELLIPKKNKKQTKKRQRKTNKKHNKTTKNLRR